MEEVKVNIHDETTHRGLLSRGSIPNYSYNKRLRIMPEEDIKASSVETQVDIKKNEAIWESCCIKTDKHAISYFGQLFVTISVLGISTFFLIKADGDCNKSSPYIGLISFLLGKILSSVVAST